MHITQAPNRHRFPASIISHTVWLYHRFNIIIVTEMFKSRWLIEVLY
ncbi:hypothetical protein [Rickettsia sp. MEAM1 (Bemisia tabaci)]|nr:hypothetical protein [Rickettsia sp. MEAM1 (Bemisia tabaci)]